MALTVDDGVVYIYNIAIVLSSVWLAQRLPGGDRTLLIGASAALALGWTIYFWVGIGPRLRIERGAKPDDEQETGQ